MPLLQELSLANTEQIRSLSFFTHGPITRTLTRLVLSYPQPILPLEELSHVHALRSLQTLYLRHVFDPTLYQVPSKLRPQLHSSHFSAD